MKRDYKHLLTDLELINVGYAMVTNNISEEIKKSYLFDKEYLKFQDNFSERICVYFKFSYNTDHENNS